MTTIIKRLYASPGTAGDAVSLLRKRRFSKSDVDLIAGSDSDNVMAAMRKAGVYERAAKIYAEHVVKGAALVVVRASFGNASRAMRMLDEFDPIDVGVPHTEVYIESKDPVYRKTRYLPELLPSNTLVFSEGLFPPAIIRNAQPRGSIIRDYKPFSSLITDKTTPFSSLLGLPLLSKRQEPRASLITGNTTPFSSALNMPTLSRER